jgi:methionine sulfoxide reductase catalytic subunit
VLAACEASADQAREDRLTPYEDVTRYNNFYEFGTGKEDPARNARDFRVRPWTVDDRRARASARTLRSGRPAPPAHHAGAGLPAALRGGVVDGHPVARLPAGRPDPQGGAHVAGAYVSFTTLHDPERMPGQRRPILDWPYREGLRMDEAMNPLTLLATGLYGRPLPGQNGAPLRLVVPWKYGFKSIKSIVRISFVEEQPFTSWSRMAPREYGFYANVNPEVDHPRWSQARERRIGEIRRRPTLPFNGYAEQVAGMYTGMDLRRFY